MNKYALTLAGGTGHGLSSITNVVEAMNISIYLTEGDKENIKITTPFDLKIAETLLLCST
jgi:2-C-methyl-D-erythritol 4-phosphate cytidylyltransferase